EPVFRFPAESFQCDGEQLARVLPTGTVRMRVGGELRGRADGTIENGFEKARLVGSDDWPMQGHHAVKNGAESIDIRASGNLLPSRGGDFGWGVLGERRDGIDRGSDDELRKQRTVRRIIDQSRVS